MFQAYHIIQAKPEDTLDFCQIVNNDLKKTVESYPKRFIALGTLPMQVRLQQVSLEAVIS